MLAYSRAKPMPLFIRVKLKPMELSYGVEAVFRDHLPRLQHGNDGLIFTGAEAPYTVGTDQRM
jgi:mRNA guanylyltransferase